MTTRTEHARIALAAFPHWSRALLRMNLSPEQRDAELAEMAAEARTFGWCLDEHGEARQAEYGTK